MDSPADPSEPWLELAPGYERARAREDSLDRLVEWPAQRNLLGDVTGRSVLDLGCGNGGKRAELVGDGATASVGVDISGNFPRSQPPGLELIQGDLSELDSVPGLAGRTFDRILFLQSFGYAKDPVRTLHQGRPTPLPTQARVDEQVSRHPDLQAPAPARLVAASPQKPEPSRHPVAILPFSGQTPGRATGSPA
jgi:SAM-dependent methyltransferase